MDVMIKVRGGTTLGGPSLCVTCRWSRIMGGESLNQEITFCEQIDSPIRFKVRNCSEYLHKNHPTLGEMREAAWILRTDPTRKAIGFVPYKNLTAEERGKLNIPYND